MTTTTTTIQYQTPTNNAPRPQFRFKSIAMSTMTAWRNRRGLLAVGATSVVVVASKVFGEIDNTHNEAKQIEQGGDSVSSFDGLSPTLPIYIFRPNKHLEIAFDTRTKNPVYVMERLSLDPNNSHQGQQQAVKLKRPNFYEEKSLPEEFRSRPSHYRNSGYDRGHLAAAANYMHLTQKEVNETFNLCNVSPQNHAMNASIWAKLERWTQKVAQENSEQSNADTYVVTGPLWLPAKQSGEKLFDYHYNAIGTPPSLISVPTHLFKIVVAIPREPSKNRKVIRFACFVVPNEEVDTKNKQQRRSLEDFLVPWSNLEAVTGLHFFPGLTVDWKANANRLTNEIMIKSSNRTKPLLLTDGSASSNTKGKDGKWGWGGKNTALELTHLCANGRCR